MTRAAFGLLCLVLSWTVAAQAHGAIPFKREPSPLETHGERVIYALAGLLALAAGGLWLLRKRQPAANRLFTFAGKSAQVVGRTRLTARCALIVVRYQEEEMLLAVSGDRVVRLDRAVPTGALHAMGEEGGDV